MSVSYTRGYTMGSRSGDQLDSTPRIDNSLSAQLGNATNNTIFNINKVVADYQNAFHEWEKGRLYEATKKRHLFWAELFGTFVLILLGNGCVAAVEEKFTRNFRVNREMRGKFYGI